MAIHSRTLSVLATLALAGCGPVDGTGPGGGETLPPITDPNIAQERTVALTTAELAYDPYRQVIYASVPASAGGSYASSIVEIDSESGTLGRSVSVGGDPGALALSDGGRYLYVAHRGSADVSRVGLSAFTVDFRQGLPGGSVASDVAAIPGRPASFAVALQSTGTRPGFDGVFVFDERTARATAVEGDTGATRIEPAGTSGRLFGYDAATERARFFAFDLTSSGVAAADSLGGLASGLDFRAAGSRVYFTDGTIVDPDFPAAIVGRFPAAGFVAPDPDRNRVFFVAPGSTQIRAFNAGTRVLLREYTAPGTGGAAGSLILLGGTGIAFRTPTQVIVVPTSRVLQQP